MALVACTVDSLQGQGQVLRHKDGFPRQALTSAAGCGCPASSPSLSILPSERLVATRASFLDVWGRPVRGFCQGSWMFVICLAQLCARCQLCPSVDKKCLQA